ncbi:MAG: LiaF transmembrane domain-containing protein [Niabella sp.]
MTDNQSNKDTYNKQEKPTFDNPGKVPTFKPRESQSHIWIGLVLLIFGAVIMLKKLGIHIPDFILSWQMFLIGLGIFIGIRKDFQGAAWLILILIGSIFMINEFFFYGELRRFILPIIFIGSGLFFIFRPKKAYKYTQYNPNGEPNERPLPSGVIPSNEDFFDTTSIFGGSKKKIFSKAFRGGNMMNVFGGSEIDLTQADISGTAIIDVTVLFGGSTILVPSNWNVVSDAVAILGEVKDKRVMTNIPENNHKTLLIKGTVIFGGIDVKSF